MNRNLMTLCLIVKNESKYLAKCVASAADIVSKTVIIDTGSKDNTPEIARNLADEFHSIPFENDFSKARNYALQFVQTPWVLYLDADESFETLDAENLLQCVSEAPDAVWGYQLTRYNFFGTGGWYTSKNLKVFRNSPQIFYEGSVSESASKSIQRGGGQIVDAPVLLNHYGHCRSVQDRDAKAHYYLKLMQGEIEKKGPNSRLMGYIGMILRTLGKFEEGLETASKGLALAPDSAHSHYCKAQVLRSMNRIEEALIHYVKASELSPNDPTFWNMVGLMHMTLGRYDEAEECFEKTYALNPILIHAYVNLGLLHQAKGNDEKALQCFEWVAARNRGFLHEDFASRMECDPYREFYYETIFKYCGLGYHLAYAREKLKRKEEVFFHGYALSL